MMPENTGQERTEQATPKRKQEARKKGQVAQSKEISSVMILMVATAFFYFAGSWMFWSLSEFVTGVYKNIDTLRFTDVAGASAFSVEILYKLLSVPRARRRSKHWPRSDLPTSSSTRSSGQVSHVSPRAPSRRPSDSSTKRRAPW